MSGLPTRFLSYLQLFVARILLLISDVLFLDFVLPVFNVS